MSNLTILNTQVRQIDNLYSLNDLHRVAGNESKHQPTFFIRLDTTQELVSEIQKEEPNTPAVIRKNGIGTYACEEIALAYAMWISPKFHLVVLRAFLKLHKNSTALSTPYLTPEEQQQVQQAVSITHHRTGLSYAEIYGRIKAKFKVAKYDQLLSAQLLDVLQFIADMNARLPNPDEVLISIHTLEALVKCCRLAKQHGEQLEPAMKTIFDMLGVERYSRNQFAARAYDLAHEFNVWINEAERLLAEKGIQLPQLRQF
ncbi:KilA-N domain-containing protein [Pasteurellaceae bacterium 22721_9_1]